MAGQKGEQEKRKEEGEDMAQLVKSRAKFLSPLGGKAELREGKHSHTLATFHVKRRQNVKTLGNYYSKTVIILKSRDIVVFLLLLFVVFLVFFANSWH